MFGLIGVALAEDPSRPTPEFGADLTVAYSAGIFVAPWPEPGVHGALLASLGLYPLAAHQHGVRVGGNFWARLAALPLPTRDEGCDDASVCVAVPFRFLQFGLDLSFRSDPMAPWGGMLDVGFGRLDVEDYYDGPLAIPMFSLRPGLRRSLGRFYVETGLRGAVGTQRNVDSGVDEWWVVGLDLGVGVHAR